MNTNKRRLTANLRRFTCLFELGIFVAVFLYIFWNGYSQDTIHPYLGRGKYILIFIYVVLNTVMIKLCDGFKLGVLKMVDITFSQWIALIVTNGITYLQLCLMANQMISVKPMLLTLGVQAVLVLIIISIYHCIYMHYAVARRMLMVYGNKESVVLMPKMNDRTDRFKITDLISIDEGEEAIHEKVLDYDALVICDVDAEKRNNLVKFCYMHGINTFVTPKISDIIISGGYKLHLFDSPLVQIKPNGLTVEQVIIKRIMDIIISLFAIILTGWLMLIIAIAIKLEDGGPVFYKQKRVTKNLEEFDILKFRSMIVDAEKHGALKATDNDSRITKVGHVIRGVRLDELPQLFNILKGEMSIVGPRPERVEYTREYTQEIPEFVFRYKVKGGLTGYAQVYGKYNTAAYDKLKMDLMYIENYSLILDIKIILMTIRVLFKKEATEGFDKVLSADDILKKQAKEKES